MIITTSDFSSKPSAGETILGFSLVEPNSSFKERAILVHLYLSSVKDIENLLEFQILDQSAGVEIVVTLTTSCNAPHIKYYVGQGKAQEIAQAVETLGAVSCWSTINSALPRLEICNHCVSVGFSTEQD